MFRCSCSGFEHRGFVAFERFLVAFQVAICFFPERWF